MADADLTDEERELLKPDPELFRALAEERRAREAALAAERVAAADRARDAQAERLPTLKPAMRVNGYRIVRDERDPPGVYHVLAEDGTAFYTGKLGRCKAVAKEVEPARG
jgi:cytochrome c biogenesis protein ResB